MNAQTAPKRMTNDRAAALFWTDFTVYVGETGGYAMNWSEWLYETQGVVLA